MGGVGLCVFVVWDGGVGGGIYGGSVLLFVVGGMCWMFNVCVCVVYGC